MHPDPAERTFRQNPPGYVCIDERRQRNTGGVVYFLVCNGSQLSNTGK